MAIHDLLQEIFYYRNHSEITVGEGADACGKHERALYYYIEGERRIDVETLRALAQYLAAEYKDFRIAEYFLPAGCVIVNGETKLNGNISDEVMRIDEAQGAAIGAARRGEHDAVADQASVIVEQGVAMKREALARKNGRNGCSH